MRIYLLSVTFLCCALGAGRSSAAERAAAHVHTVIKADGETTNIRVLKSALRQVPVYWE